MGERKFVFLMQHFCRIIEGNACMLVYGLFDPEGVAYVELP